MKRTFFGFLAAVCVTACMFSACSQKVQDDPLKDYKAQIVGEWQVVEQPAAAAVEDTAVVADSTQVVEAVSAPKMLFSAGTKFVFTENAITIGDKSGEYTWNKTKEQSKLRVESALFHNLLSTNDRRYATDPLVEFNENTVTLSMQYIEKVADVVKEKTKEGKDTVIFKTPVVKVVLQKM